MQVFDHGVQLVSKGVVEPSDTKEGTAKRLNVVQKDPVVSWDYCFLEAKNRSSEAEVAKCGDSPVLVIHDGVTKSIFAHLVPTN